MALVCSGCESTDIVEVRAEGCYVCNKCGLVVVDCPIYDDHESYYTNGDGSVSMVRHGAPLNPLLEQSSLSTMIQYSHKFKRMKQMHDRLSMNYTERALYHAFNYITRVMEDKLALPKSAIDIAKLMYKDMKEKRISRGLIHKALTAACVYFACKVHGNLKMTKHEVACAFEVTAAKLNKACKIFRDITKDKPYFMSMFDEIQVSEIVVRMADKLVWRSDTDKWNVIKVVRAMDDLIKHYGNLDNKHINSVLAALIYIASTELDVRMLSPSSNKIGKVTKSVICNVYDLTLITLNKTIKEVQRVVEQHTSVAQIV